MNRFLTLIIILALAPSVIADPPDNSSDVVVTPKTHDRHLRNPGMGLILYYHPDPALKTLPDEADVLYMTLVWHDIETQPGQYHWADQAPIIPRILNGDPDPNLGIKLLTQALRLAKENDRHVAIRLATSWQNYPSPIPDYLLDKGVKLFPYSPKDLKDWPFKCFFEPEWWNPNYCDAFNNLIKAYGSQFDGNPLIAFIDMRYYGFWGEGHRWHNTQPWPADVDLRQYCKKWIDLHLDSFHKTPLVVQTASDENVPYPQGTAIDYALSKGAWMRRDGFGSFLNSKEIDLLDANWKTSVLIAENGRSFQDHLDGKVFQASLKKTNPVTLEDLFDEMFAHHVNYIPLGWSVSDFKLLKDKKPELLQKASLKIGYRFIITEARWPKSPREGTEIQIQTTWRNTAVGHLPFPYQPRIYLLDRSNQVIAESPDSEKSDPTTWIAGTDYPITFKLKAPPANPDGYSIAASIVDEKQIPIVSLGIEGDDTHKHFILGPLNPTPNP